MAEEDTHKTYSGNSLGPIMQLSSLALPFDSFRNSTSEMADQINGVVSAGFFDPFGQQSKTSRPSSGAAANSCRTTATKSYDKITTTMEAVSMIQDQGATASPTTAVMVPEDLRCLG
ncbi:MAG: hypothetical protein J3Q66DRAFT_369486 [Benniella sp.]|nr:MAG: hypothetical protein J3Q66DRAFT_369486 [Benniella sp.]